MDTQTQQDYAKFLENAAVLILEVWGNTTISEKAKSAMLFRINKAVEAMIQEHEKTYTN